MKRSCVPSQKILIVQAQHRLFDVDMYREPGDMGNGPRFYR
jgi:hypothetical protein